MLSSMNSTHENIRKNNDITKHISSFTIIQRAIFILSIIVLFWFLFVITYLSSRLIIRLISKLQRYYSNSSLSSNPKVCQAFVISSNQYGSFRPIQSLYRSDSLFSNSNFKLTNEQITAISNYGTMHLTINHHSNLIEKNFQYQQSKTSLLEHYLKTYNPLEIDLTNTNDETITTSNVKASFSFEELPSETDTRPLGHCYPLNCTNKQRLYHTRRYVRLKEQENCSVTMSITDDRLSECSTQLTSTALPTLMITDCSDSQRLHTDIIEMNEDE